MKMVSLALYKKFNPFYSNPIDVFVKYNKQFSLPKCLLQNIKCKCYSKRKEIEIDFYYPMIFIKKYKQKVRKNILMLEKHNNSKIINYNNYANFVSEKLVLNSLKDHVDILSKFLTFISSSQTKSKKFMHYIHNQVKYNRKYFFLSEKNFLKNKRKTHVHYITLNVSYYNTYHTLKMFELYVNKYMLK